MHNNRTDSQLLKPRCCFSLFLFDSISLVRGGRCVTEELQRVFYKTFKRIILDRGTGHEDLVLIHSRINVVSTQFPFFKSIVKVRLGRATEFNFSRLSKEELYRYAYNVRKTYYYYY